MSVVSSLNQQSNTPSLFKKRFLEPSVNPKKFLGFLFFLIILYAVIAPLGSTIRSVGIGNLGISTILFILIILFGFFKGIKVVRKSKIYQTLIILGLWILLSTFFTESKYIPNIPAATYFLFYILFSAVVAYISALIYPSWITKIYIYTALGTSIFSTIVLMDFYGLTSFNVGEKLFVMYREEGNRVLTTVTGLFNDRTTSAIIFSLLAPGWFVLFIESKKRLYAFLFAYALIVNFIVILNTHNRLGIIALAISVCIYIFKHFRKLGRVLVLFALFLLLLPIFTTVLADAITAYSFKFSTTLDSETNQGRSDLLRLETLQTSVENLAVNPFGNGWSRIPHNGDMRDTHSLLSFILWSSGMFGIVAIVIIIFVSYSELIQPYMHLSKQKIIFVRPCLYSLIGLFVMASGHSVIGTGILWLWLGLLFGQISRK